MKNKVAFACPLYDMKNHFQLALSLCISKVEYEINSDFYIVFSNESQKDKFFSLLTEKKIDEHFNWLILPEKYQNYKSKAVTKKFEALHELKNRYEYIVLVDSESIFVRKFDADKLCEEIWNKRTMLNSNISPDGFYIMRKCYKTMGLYYNRKLRKELENYKYNFWFNDLQVYKCQYLDGFFEWLDEHNRDGVYDTKECFEYYVFYAYILLEYDIHINKYQYISMGGINEYLPAFPPEKQTEIINSMNLHWASTEEAKTENVVMLFHLDRSKEDDEYSYQKMKNARKILFKRRLTLIKDFFVRD